MAFSYLPQMKRAEGGDDSDIPLDERTRNTNTIVTISDYFSSFFFSPCLYEPGFRMVGGRLDWTS